MLKKGTKRSWLILGLVLAVAAGIGWGYYRRLVERTEALSMQAMLVEASVAEEYFFMQEKKYTDRWLDLLPFIKPAESLQVEIVPSDTQAQQCFFGFGPGSAKQQNGYQVSVWLAADGHSGTFTARRVGAGKPYELTRPFPDGEETRCSGREAFCKQFEEAVSAFEFKNLIPVSKEKKDTPHRADTE